MNSKTKRPLATLIAAVMAFSLLTAFPLTASAATASELKATIESFDPGPGSTGSLSAEAFSNYVAGTHTVTVTGAVTDATKILSLNINSGVTVIWRADYSGSTVGMPLIILLGSGTFEVRAGSVIQTGDFIGIQVNGSNTVKVSGGRVTSTERTAIYAGPSVEVSGGAVASNGGCAISGHDINVSGGLVFGVGTGLTGAISASGTAIQFNPGGSAAISGDAVVCAWDKAIGNTTYYEHSSDDLICNDGATVKWGKSGPQSGISYASGANTGFFPVGGVTVGDAYVKVTNIFGVPDAMTVDAPLTLAGSVTPAGATNAAITWSVSNAGGTGATISGNTLTVTAAGTAVVTATVINGETPDTNYTQEFTITVAPSGAPQIEGAAAMTLTHGYEATSTGVFTLTGDPAPTVEIISGDTKFSWDNAAKKLIIAAGLTPGTYEVILKAANGKTPDAMFTFTLTVTAYFAEQLPFTDVNETDWFYNDVKLAWSRGYINGKTDTTFAPGDNLTYAEAVKLAACLHQRYFDGEVTLTNSSPDWYQSYVDYAKATYIISKDYAWNEPATRAGYMEIFVNALPDYVLSAFNIVPDGAIPDVPMTHPQAAAIYKMYRAGIVQGVDAATHMCAPESNIVRREVAVILNRMTDVDSRIPFSMQ